MNDDHTTTMPKARVDRLIIKELPDETLVYDLDTDQAHCLNQTAALVWESCDGNNTVHEIKAALALKAGVPADERIVWLALDQLEEFKLLEQKPNRPPAFAGLNRRQLIRTIGLAAVTLPTVVSIIAPTSSQAASCNAASGRDPGCDCTASNQCASNCCRSSNLKCGTTGCL